MTTIFETVIVRTLKLSSHKFIYYNLIVLSVIAYTMIVAHYPNSH